jgi:hypothetical protein
MVLELVVEEILWWVKEDMNHHLVQTEIVKEWANLIRKQSYSQVKVKDYTKKEADKGSLFKHNKVTMQQSCKQEDLKTTWV